MQRCNLLIVVVALVVALLSTAAPTVAAARKGVSCRVLKNPFTMASRKCLCQPCYACEFSIMKGGCSLIPVGGASLSDGSDQKLDQPELDPKEWFLTEDEMTLSRWGVPRADLELYTTGNEVTSYVVGDEYFRAVLDEFDNANENDRIFLTGWSVDDVPFDPTKDQSGATTGFKKLISNAVNRGADFRSLVWPNLLERRQNIKMRDFINRLPLPKAHGPARFVFDDRLPAGGIASHHQKSVIFDKDDDLVAYVGGIDLTNERWDTIKHDQAALRRSAKIRRLFDGWLDAQLKLHGPAAKDVANNFLSRWNSGVKPSQGIIDDLLDFENPNYEALPAVNMTNKKLAGSGTSAVQVARTFSCKTKKYHEFAPRGENSLFHARIKAIRNAKNYIYIEDQYFVLVPELLDELLKAMPRINRLVVVAQRTIDATKVTGYERFLYDMVAPIQRLYPNKFQLYTTRKDRKLYIHTKAFIVDDVYLSVGSSNWNRRSMTSDSEIGANVVDTEIVSTPDGITVNKVARDFRIRKFQEMTGLGYDDLVKMTFIDAANALDAATTSSTGIIEPLEVDNKPYYAAFTTDIRQLVDPQDSC
ncbi:TPA: hypothetical protein N0F65_009632 [Lagenidium giganteum]|uniref:phospholipase D n=1 Tax=Lagenidium giganteum TaxID=4803 RepID=A0AAV2YFB4_9STRA|nr:TPA: hypothetical protein N0F65_009632 [Lagenidium giganteum]